MHILADKTGRSAIWAAQRVPDDHVAVVPNQFVIDRINVSDSENFMASPNIAQAAIDAGFLDASVSEKEGGEDNFHFSAAFSLDYVPGENDGKGEMRRWRVFSVLAPSRDFRPDQHTRFPFSVRVEKKVDVRDIMALMRDHFEGEAQSTSTSAGCVPWRRARDLLSLTACVSLLCSSPLQARRTTRPRASPRDPTATRTGTTATRRCSRK